MGGNLDLAVMLLLLSTFTTGNGNSIPTTTTPQGVFETSTDKLPGGAAALPPTFWIFPKLLNLLVLRNQYQKN